MTTCTWKGCSLPAKHPQIDRNGNPWADLCDAHHWVMEDAIADPRPPKLMMKVWIMAQGGSEAATQRMKPGIVSVANAMADLLKQPRPK